MDVKGSIQARVLLAAFAWSGPALAHCDTLDGPVVGAARKALDSGNVNLMLVWVQPKDEAGIRNAFQKTRNVHKAGGEAKELADMYFFETLVRLHRAGEGAGYTGLKPAGTVEPPVAAADEAIDSGKLQPLGRLVSDSMEKGLHAHFDQVMAKRKYDPKPIESQPGLAGTRRGNACSLATCGSSSSRSRP